MTEFAKRLMRIDRANTKAKTARAIFGSIGDMQTSLQAQSQIRIGMWPCQSDTHPIQAMGIWASLAYLLESWDDVLVYRIFVNLKESSSLTEMTWSIEQSQFSIDDWYVEKLDENVAIWGELLQADDIFWLNVFIENDNLTGDAAEDVVKISINADSIVELVANLPVLARQIAEELDAGNRDELIPSYDVESIGLVDSLFPIVVYWEARLLIYLAGKEWDDRNILEQYDNLIAAVASPITEFQSWLIAHIFAQSMRPGYSVIGELLVSPAQKFANKVSDTTTIPAIIIAPALYEMGYTKEAYVLLENAIISKGGSPSAYIQLSELYLASGRIIDGIDCLQRAIENQAVNALLFRYYGNTLSTLEQYDEVLPACILVDPQEYPEDFVQHEAIQAFAESLKFSPNDTRSLYGKLLQKIQIHDIDEEFWQNFESLTAIDSSGDYVANLIDAMYTLDPEMLTTGVEIIEEMLQEEERRDLLINLSLLFMVQDMNHKSIPYLKKALDLSQEVSEKAEVERLLLAAQDSEFEYRMGELSAIVQAGNTLSSDDTEFLEFVVNEAPHSIEGHLLLSQAYDAWGDTDAALDVLLDAHERLPISPDVVDHIGRLLWNAGEKELAFHYLNQGLQSFPRSTTLLIRVARYLFDNGQLEEARTFLSAAEEISPRDPFLQQLRKYISTKVAENPDAYDIK